LATTTRGKSNRAGAKPGPRQLAANAYYDEHPDAVDAKAVLKELKAAHPKEFRGVDKTRVHQLRYSWRKSRENAGKTTRSVAQKAPTQRRRKPQRRKPQRRKPPAVELSLEQRVALLELHIAQLNVVLDHSQGAIKDMLSLTGGSIG
jgi:hypothetical protein